MRICVLFAMPALILLGGVAIGRADPAKESGTERAARIAKLIQQLGHKDFAKRRLSCPEQTAGCASAEIGAGRDVAAPRREHP